jgi:hypothetical protein
MKSRDLTNGPGCERLMVSDRDSVALDLGRPAREVGRKHVGGRKKKKKITENATAHADE